MALLDHVLAVAAANKAGFITLEEGAPARFNASDVGDATSLTRTAVSRAQIASLLRDIAPAGATTALERGASIAFDYQHADASLSGRAAVHAGQWRVAIHLGNGAAHTTSRPVAVTTTANERVDALLELAVKYDASDLHLRVGEPPLLRCQGEVVRLTDWQPLALEDVTALLAATMPAAKHDEFAKRRETDYPYEVASARFRVNAFHDHHGPAAAIRRIATRVVTADDLGLSKEIRQLAQLTRGLVLVTGATGSGKTTTLGALIDLVNRTRNQHIITIEDPIEFVHENARCIVSQREVGRHTRGFRSALRAALREDPDVLLIGELRDLATTAIAIEAAETGHLVFASMHTMNAAMTIDRVIDQYPALRQSQIRVMLADSLRAIISQTLCRSVDGRRVAAREVLFNTPAVANLIRERKTYQLTSVMQTSARLGMTTLNDALVRLVVARKITADEAFTHAYDKAALARGLKGKADRRRRARE